jgi:glycosyltransferase involved in cell wall biosynthesis
VCIAANTSWYVRNFRSALITRLKTEGFHVYAYSPRDRYVGTLTELGATHVHLALNNASTNPLGELLALYRMARELRRMRPAVLLTYTPKVNIYGSLAAAMLRIPVIANVSGLGHAFTSGGWLEHVSRALYRLALRHPRLVFFQNEHDKQEFTSAGIVDPRKCVRLPGSGVDLSKFQPRGRDQETRQFAFLLASRLLWDKGVGVFVDAARIVKARAPQVEFRLLGFPDVDNPSAISPAQIDEWQAEGVVRYLGVTDDIAREYARADCFVLPSFYREGVPRSVLEAASMGLPVITTDMPGCRDAVDDGRTGLLCRARDSQDLAKCMLEMLQMPSRAREAMGTAGREKMARDFDERIVLDLYMQSVAAILRNR